MKISANFVESTTELVDSSLVFRLIGAHFGDQQFVPPNSQLAIYLALECDQSTPVLCPARAAFSPVLVNVLVNWMEGSRSEVVASSHFL